jgi:hypothetical protein
MAAPINRYATPEFAPYALALGELTLAWNDLQEELCRIFSIVMSDAPVEGTFVDWTPVHAWAAVRSDRSQRAMLQAVAENPPRAWAQFANWQTEVVWLIQRSNELEDSRNNAVHAPLFDASQGLLSQIIRQFNIESSYSGEIIPSTFQRNFRALNLSQKTDLLGQFHYCRDAALILADHAGAIAAWLINRQRPWPERPSLPNKIAKKTRSPPVTPNR